MVFVLRKARFIMCSYACEIVVEVSVKRERDVMSVLSTFVVCPIPRVFSRGGIIDRIWNKQKTTKSSKSIIKKTTHDFLRDQQKLESVNTHDALESFDVVFSVHYCYS